MIIFLGDDTEYKQIIADSREDSDIVVSCQYRHKVPGGLLMDYPCVNIHYGLLPYYAGCNPIYWQIMKGDTAGVTLHYMDESFDGGDIIDSYQVPIGNMHADELYDCLKQAGKKLLARHYNSIVDGTAARKPQNLNHRHYYKQDAVNFSDEKLCNITEDKKIRAIHFKGKQHPIVALGGRHYEMRCCDSSL